MRHILVLILLVSGCAGQQHVNSSRPDRTAREGEAGVPALGETFRDCPICPEMVVVPPGTFLMGSPEDQEGRNPSEGPQHRVDIDYSFAVAKFEVTFNQ